LDARVVQNVPGQAGKEETVPSGDSRGELSLPQKRIVDGFDEVAKGLADGTISRGRALKLTGSALLGGGLLAMFPGVAGAQVSVQAGCAGKPSVNNKKCPETNCGGNTSCFCATTVANVKTCVNFVNEVCPTRDECDRNRDCASGEVCIKIGGCCGRPRRNLCIRRCS
jgi:hypothetical protein